MRINERYGEEACPVKALVIVFSYHHRNTEMIAHAIAGILGAPVKTPQQVTPEEIAEYDLIGFGSGIYASTFDASMLDLVGRLPQADTEKAFLFSTYGAPAIIVNPEFIEKNHRRIREKLQSRGYEVISEFSCAGWNTNSFLRFFGGLNKGRPDARDRADAEAFAHRMMGNVGREQSRKK